MGLPAIFATPGSSDFNSQLAAPGAITPTAPGLLGQFVPQAPASAPSTGNPATWGPSPGAANNNAQVAAAHAAAAAQAAQQAKIDQIRSSGQNQQIAQGDASAGNAASNYQTQAGTLYGQLQQGQNNIDEARKNIGISQISSIKDLMNTIRQGLQGTGVQLANSNALDSSASGAAARAYANYGNVQTNKVNNDAATKQSDQDVAQTNLGVQHDVGTANLKAFRDSQVSSITADAIKGLEGLKQYIAMVGGDGSSVDEEGIKQQILNDAQGKLAGVDSYIQNQVNGVHAADRGTLGDQAYTASNAGVIPSGSGLPFQLANPSTSTPATLGGADTSLIPLALKPRTSTT